MSFHINFGEDPCTRTGAIGVNANFISCACYYANFISCARVYASCACVRTRILTKIFVGVHYKHKNLILRFHKDPSFRCGDICKSILTFENHQISMYFPWYDISLHQLLIKNISGSIHPPWVVQYSKWSLIYTEKNQLGWSNKIECFHRDISQNLRETFFWDTLYIIYYINSILLYYVL